MADKKVTKTGKDNDGDITKLGGSWGNASKAIAIQDIDNGTNSYYVQQPNCGRSEVRVVEGTTGSGLHGNAAYRSF